MPKCDICNREFATAEGLEQHNRDKHAAQSLDRHELKKQKKQQRLMEQAEENKKLKSGKRMKMIAMVLGISFVLAAVVYAVVFIFPNQGTIAQPGGELVAGSMDNSLFNFNLKQHSGSLSLHIHPQVEIEINGEKQLIPVNIGISPQGMRVIHTHESDGKLHVESPYPHQFVLADFFAIWNKTFSSTCIFEYCTDENHTLTVFVNDVESNEYGNIPLYDLDRIKIVYSEKE